MEKDILKRYILPIVAIPGLGFVLLNIMFVLDFLYQMLINWIFEQFQGRTELGPISVQFPFSLHVSFALLVCIGFIPLFLSKLPIWLKAVFMTIPSAFVLATMGIILNRTPVLSVGVSVILLGGVLSAFYKTKQPWEYYYSVLIVAATLFLGMLFGMQI